VIKTSIKSDCQNKSFAKDAALKTGYSEITIMEDIRIATDLAPDIQEELIKKEFLYYT